MRKVLAASLLVSALLLSACFGIWERGGGTSWTPGWKEPVENPRDWKAIVIHHSASARGNAATFDEWHKAKGWDGLGYHFVIGNGTGSGNGEIEIGFRWHEQREGAHAGNTWYNQHGIGICLVGNFEEEESEPTFSQMTALVRLCIHLTEIFGIPDSAIVPHKAVRDAERGTTDCPGKNFDMEEFRGLVAGTREKDPR
ncbi:MAG: N-acetylmuramoyl-L-alanine amidase [Planctomycetes bacterium]|nr:N-acetylmuramoyl-L-alanine amidase [Planctomycetota bacterium]